MGEWRCSSKHYDPRHSVEVSGQFHDLADYMPCKEFPVPHGVRLWVGSHSLSGHCVTFRFFVPAILTDARFFGVSLY